MHRLTVCCLLLLGLLFTACGADDPATTTSGRFAAPETPVNVAPPAPIAAPEVITEPTPTPEPTPAIDRDFTPVRVLVDVLEVVPHDDKAFTQGFEFDGDTLYESTGASGAQSMVRRLDPSTGEVLQLVEVPGVFLEGITVVGDEIYGLTWQDRRAFVFDKTTFEVVREYSYDTEGWGLCENGAELIMSDGSSNLYVRDPASFELVRTIPVTLEGLPVDQLNELECVNGRVWANVWLTDAIYEIDLAIGVVTTVVDAASLNRPRPEDGQAVLNGIAYNETTGNFLLTGKRWDEAYVVQFVEV